MAEASSWIIETTTDRFEQDVVERSKQNPVVVDFWAPWCEPCRQLAPLLEKLIEEQAGRVTLVKVNIDESPEIAQAVGVQSIPFVMALRDAQAVDHFMGVLPEPELRQWFKSILPSPTEELVKRGLEAEAQDPQTAESCFREAAELAPDDDSIRVHLVRVLLALKRDDECRSMVDELAKRGFLEPEVEAIRSQLELREAAEEAGSVLEARRAVETDPDDPSLKLKLADVLAVEGKHREALELCLAIVMHDRTGLRGEAKETMVKVFDMLGPSSELTSEFRRKLATALY